MLEPATAYLDKKARMYFNSLPDTLICYRGCSRARVRGLSWTADYNVAETFARGHRHIMVSNPVVVTARFPKEAIFFPALDRKETELVLDPRLGRLKSIEPR